MKKKVVKKLKVGPDRSEELSLFAAGYRRVAGLDEAGRGALAGPVVAAVVILPEDADYHWLSMVKDSKQLQEAVREDIFTLMEDSGLEFNAGIISPRVIDNINILNATKKAMKLAVEGLKKPPDYLLTDAVPLPRLRIPQKGIVKGDCSCLVISCASVVAKVTRDRIMMKLDAKYPRYKFRDHKGYGTSEHLKCLQLYGACTIHRMTFGPVRDLARII
ncbi:MAG: ribonuclease HII [Dehalococcoidia bacterium]